MEIAKNSVIYFAFLHGGSLKEFMSKIYQNAVDVCLYEMPFPICIYTWHIVKQVLSF